MIICALRWALLARLVFEPLDQVRGLHAGVALHHPHQLLARLAARSGRRSARACCVPRRATPRARARAPPGSSPAPPGRCSCWPASRSRRSNSSPALVERCPPSGRAAARAPRARSRRLRDAVSNSLRAWSSFSSRRDLRLALAVLALLVGLFEGAGGLPARLGEDPPAGPSQDQPPDQWDREGGEDDRRREVIVRHVHPLPGSSATGGTGEAEEEHPPRSRVGPTLVRTGAPGGCPPRGPLDSLSEQGLHRLPREMGLPSKECWLYR